MGQSHPPLNWLRSFEAAARQLSFTAAAEELNLTQSAISQQIRSLEVRLGVQLFIRKARGLELTDDGRKLLPKIGSALDNLSSAISIFDAGPTQGLLTIATSVSVSQWLIAPNIHAFLARHPDLRIRILSTIWPDDFKTSIADVEIRFGSEKQVGHSAKRLTPDTLIVVANPQIASEVTDLDFGNQPLIEAVGTSEGWRNWAAKSKIDKDLKPNVYVDSHGLALDLVVNGHGVALTSSLLAGPSLQAGKVIQINPVEINSTEGFFLAVDDESSIANEFSIWFKEQCLAGSSK